MQNTVSMLKMIIVLDSINVNIIHSVKVVIKRWGSWGMMNGAMRKKNGVMGPEKVSKLPISKSYGLYLRIIYFPFMLF